MRQALIASGIAISLSACSWNKAPPAFSASGYVADQGVVRIWRQDDDRQRPRVLMAVYSPYRGAGTTMTHYEYQNGVLWQIKRTSIDSDKDAIQLRFADDGSVSFMQRQLATRREQLSADDIARYSYQARRVLALSDALRVGKVQLLQGRWQQGMVQTCAGKRINPGLNRSSIAWIERREKNSRGPLSIAWLDAPEGRELLLVANEDFCHWEPKEGSL
ncbi:DUF1481 domain-containing protein [Serratia sp. NPDC078593]|uniref:DUF1481 domain-containing protein n=1 Tax=unclassified Serratia (in: enterobacteria) TaxID=2647522 RepID=UPI0037CD2B00